MGINSQINFIGIGAAKAGTTWLHSNLKKLPGFSLPPIKEIHYFDRDPKYPSPNFLYESKFLKRFFNLKWNFHTSKAILKSISEEKNIKLFRFYWKWYFSNYNKKWYTSLFEANKISGEITPSYSILEERDIQEMYRIAPDAKIILLLRNPIERAWSHYRFRADIIQKDDEYSNNKILDFINSDAQLLRSDYIKILKNFSSIYPSDQILICFYDAIIEDPKKLLSEIIDFVGGTSDEIDQYCNLNKKVGVSRKINCPATIKSHLELIYYDQIKELAETYGGYFNKWLIDTYGETSTNPSKVLYPAIKCK